jgi:hypothetical protein
MSVPPETDTEYSRGSGPSRPLHPGRRWVSSRSSAPSASPTAETGDAASARRDTGRAAVALIALLGALLIIVSQFTALYQLHSTAGSAAIKTVETGPNHAWAPIPLALVAMALAYAVYRHGNRPALVGLAVLGIATLLIALLGDLSDAHSSGLIGSSAGGYLQATSSPRAGLYIETLGAVVLVLAGGVGLLMPGSHRPRGTRPAAGPNTAA